MWVVAKRSHAARDVGDALERVVDRPRRCDSWCRCPCARRPHRPSAADRRRSFRRGPRSVKAAGRRSRRARPSTCRAAGYKARPRQSALPAALERATGRCRDKVARLRDRRRLPHAAAISRRCRSRDRASPAPASRLLRSAVGRPMLGALAHRLFPVRAQPGQVLEDLPDKCLGGSGSCRCPRCAAETGRRPSARMARLTRRKRRGRDEARRWGWARIGMSSCLIRATHAFMTAAQASRPPPISSEESQRSCRIEPRFAGISPAPARRRCAGPPAASRPWRASSSSNDLAQGGATHSLSAHRAGRGRSSRRPCAAFGLRRCASSGLPTASRRRSRRWRPQS